MEKICVTAYRKELVWLVIGEACDFNVCVRLSYGCTIIYLITLLLLDIGNVFNSCCHRAYFDMDPLPVSRMISLR